MVAAARHRLLGRGHCLKGLHQMRAAALVALRCTERLRFGFTWGGDHR